MYGNSNMFVRLVSDETKETGEYFDLEHMLALKYGDQESNHKTISRLPPVIIFFCASDKHN